MKEFLATNFVRFLIGMFIILISNIVFVVWNIFLSSNIAIKMFGEIGVIILGIFIAWLLGYIAYRSFGESK